MQLQQLLSDGQRILIFTGAGISTGSGIRDFRGPQGVWKERQPVYYQDFMSNEYSRWEYWDYKLEGWESFKSARPNAVHSAIVDLEKADKVELVLTQNVDGLHKLAGTSPQKLVEIHGSNLEIECQSCGRLSPPEPHFEKFRKTQKAPKCRCGGFLKPATISFGQNLRDADIDRAVQAAEKADLVVALGSTLSVNPAASLPLIAVERGAPYVIINRGETAHDGMSEVTLRIDGDVNELFPPAVAGALEG